MKELNILQMEEIEGGMTASSALGGACGAVILIGMFGGFVGLIGALIVGPSVCGTGLALGISGK